MRNHGERRSDRHRRRRAYADWRLSRRVQRLCRPESGRRRGEGGARSQWDCARGHRRSDSWLRLAGWPGSGSRPSGRACRGLAGGMESMSNAPYLLDRARSGYRMGHGRLLDHMFLDGLEDAYGDHLPMGAFAEDCAERFQFTRAAQDAFAIASLERAQRAIGDGSFAKEIAPVTVKSGKAEVRVVLHDEQPLKAKLDKIPHLKPAFREGGSVTAANSSSISDGAAALVLVRRSEAEKRGITPLATILAHATHAQAPSQFATAPIGALRKLMDKTGWSLADVDLFEINEAFAVVAMGAMQELSLPCEKVNGHGGACALGHPIGA